MGNTSNVNYMLKELDKILKYSLEEKILFFDKLSNAFETILKQEGERPGYGWYYDSQIKKLKKLMKECDDTIYELQTKNDNSMTKNRIITYEAYKSCMWMLKKMLSQNFTGKKIVSEKWFKKLVRKFELRSKRYHLNYQHDYWDATHP